MNDINSVVVYRSRFEQTMDEFWYDHPEWVIGIAVSIFVLVLIMAILSKYEYTLRWKWNRLKKNINQWYHKTFRKVD